MTTILSNPGPIQDLKALSDSQLLKLSVKNPDYFGELVTRYEPAFTRKALSILGNREDATDAVQETFVRIYAAAKRFSDKEGASFSSWGYAILTNRCFTAYSAGRKMKKVSLDQEPEMADIIPDDTMAREHEVLIAREYVLSLLSRLPELLRKVVTLHFIQGKKTKEIASQLGISDGAVRARIHRAKRALRRIGDNMLKFEGSRLPRGKLDLVRVRI